MPLEEVEEAKSHLAPLRAQGVEVGLALEGRRDLAPERGNRTDSAVGRYADNYWDIGTVALVGSDSFVGEVDNIQMGLDNIGLEGGQRVGSFR